MAISYIEIDNWHGKRVYNYSMRKLDFNYVTDKYEYEEI